jgi:hypothetical protein
MAEAQRADHQTRHDLVADAQQRHAVEHGVGQGDAGGQRNGVAAEERQLHALIALRHAVAHGGHAAGDLHGGADLAGVDLHGIGVAAIGLMRGEHVVIGRHDRQIGRLGEGHGLLVALGPGIGMRQVGAAEEAVALAMPVRLGADHVEIARAARLGPFDDARGDALDGG